MKLDKKTMLKLMKEEYEKRLKYYLQESYLSEIETKDEKRDDINLIKNAQGLKVKNQQGLEMTIDGFEIIDGHEYIVLRKPDDARHGLDGLDSTDHMSSVVRESDVFAEEAYEEEEEVEGDDPKGSRSLQPKNKDMDYKRTFRNNDYDAAKDSLSGKKIQNDKVYILVAEFEQEYSL